MLIFLYGPDIYRSRQKLQEIIERYKKIHQSGLNLKYFDLKKTNFQELWQEIQAVSMFKEKKLIVLENTFFNLEFEKKFLENSQNFLNLKDLILFYEKGEVDQRRPLFKFLKKSVKSQEFQLLSEEKLKSWLKKEFANYQTEIEEKAIRQLINFVGNNLWQMSNEIKKLVAYKNGQKIKIEDVELLVRSKIETDIFKSIDALAEKNKKKALSLIHGHLEKGDSPLYLLTMINFQFRNLLEIKDMIERNLPYQVILKKSGLHPFVAKKSYFQAKNFSLSELKRIYQKLFEADLNIKTGRLDPQTALDLLITEI